MKENIEQAMNDFKRAVGQSFNSVDEAFKHFAQNNHQINFDSFKLALEELLPKRYKSD